MRKDPDAPGGAQAKLVAALAPYLQILRDQAKAGGPLPDDTFRFAFEGSNPASPSIGDGLGWFDIIDRADAKPGLHLTHNDDGTIDVMAMFGAPGPDGDIYAILGTYTVELM